MQPQLNSDNGVIIWLFQESVGFEYKPVLKTVASGVLGWLMWTVWSNINCVYLTFHVIICHVFIFKWNFKLVSNYCFLLFSAEDPSENYVKLRDYVLVKLCQTLPSFSTDKLPLSFSDDMATEAREKLKINKVNLSLNHRGQRRIHLITVHFSLINPRLSSPRGNMYHFI